jgi:hypothetical protein
VHHVQLGVGVVPTTRRGLGAARQHAPHHKVARALLGPRRLPRLAPLRDGTWRRAGAGARRGVGLEVEAAVAAGAVAHGARAGGQAEELALRRRGVGGRW